MTSVTDVTAAIAGYCLNDTCHATPIMRQTCANAHAHALQEVLIIMITSVNEKVSDFFYHGHHTN